MVKFLGQRNPEEEPVRNLTLEENPAAATETPAFQVKGLPEFQSYMPFLLLTFPQFEGESATDAELIWREYINQALFVAERWHSKIEELLRNKKIDQEKADDFHLHIADALGDFATNPDPHFWQSLPADKLLYINSLIKAYLEEHSRNKPKSAERAKARNAPPEHVIPAEHFQVNGAFQEDGCIWSDFSTSDTHIIYGPYLTFPEGVYDAVFLLEYQSKFSVPTLLVRIDAVLDGKVVAEKEIGSTELFYSTRPPRLVVEVTNPRSPIEFRIYVGGRPYQSRLVFTGVQLFKHLAL